MTNPIRKRGQAEPVVFNPKMDPSEERAKDLAIDGSYVTKLISRKKQAKIFGKAHKLVNLAQNMREKGIDSSLLSNSEEIVKLKKEIDKENAERKARGEAVLSGVFSGSQNVQAFAIKKILESYGRKTDRAMSYLDMGFDIANNILKSGRTLNLVIGGKSSPEFEVAWKTVQDQLDAAEASKAMIESVRQDFTFFVNLSIQCVQLDRDTENLAHIEAKIAEKQANQDVEGVQNKKSKKTQMELNRLRLQVKELKIKIDNERKELPLSALKKLAEKGSSYSEAISRLMKTSSSARAFLGNMAKHLLLVGGIFNFTSAMSHLIEIGKNIFETEKKIDVLKKKQPKIPNNLNPTTKLLINNVFSFKIMHLEKSKIRLKTEAAFSMLRALVASVELTEVSIACFAILCGVVIATPGLNTATMVLGILLVVGIKSVEIISKLKHKEEMRLELQNTEESARIFTLSGQFHTKTDEFQKLQVDLGDITREEAEINALIKELYEKQDAYSREQFEAIQLYLALQLNPIVNKRNVINNKYSELHSELYMMSLELDAIIAKKNIVQDHHSIELLAQEFKIQQADLLRMKGMFKNALESEEIKKEFVDFLTEKGVAITSEDDIFASVLRFIRTDSETLEDAVE